jgi:pimeloyl-ACP methyl ester carboxylesterase
MASQMGADGIEDRDISFPKAIYHSFHSNDGRTVSYCTFDNDVPVKENPHPVVYMHGFPGTGIQGAACALQVAQAGGELFGLDRPGFGDSDPLPEEWDKEELTQGVTDTVWALVEHQQWKEFSLIGMSGGGPYILAVLLSYLEKGETAPAKLVAISHVAGACFSAGTEGTIPENKMFFTLVNNSEGWWARTQLRFIFFVMSILPKNLFMRLMANKSLAPVDQEALANQAVRSIYADSTAGAFKQGIRSCEKEAAILFRSHPPWEHRLKKYYEGGDKPSFPRVGLFQGSLDENVPQSHAKYVHEEIFKKASKLWEYPDLGHISLETQKQDDFAQFAVYGMLGNE